MARWAEAAQDASVSSPSRNGTLTAGGPDPIRRLAGAVVRRQTNHLEEAVDDALSTCIADA